MKNKITVCKTKDCSGVVLEGKYCRRCNAERKEKRDKIVKNLKDVGKATVGIVTLAASLAGSKVVKR